ncbi:Kinase [Hexamita inflata]|uniref:Kinase n=1 Tax=Hexamita inflata TaxID=28002 RepID=A0ABP1GEJ1_9EUKA
MTNKYEGYYSGKKGEMLNNQYQIQKELGSGTFGSVFQCIDKQRNKYVAVKILRAIDKYYEAGQAELKTLIQVRPLQCQQVVEVLDYFDFSGHLCIVFPLYGQTLLELLKANEFRGYNIDWTRELSKSFLLGIQAVHSLNKIHTDIKPENIMSKGKPVSTTVRGRVFVHPPGADLVLIDLGSSVEVDKRKPVLVCTRQYRPPEVMLGLDFDYKLDVWSAGCCMFETITGRTLYRTHNTVCHLMQIQKILGKMPVNMYQQAAVLKRCKELDSYDLQTGLWCFPSNYDEFEKQALAGIKTIEDELEGNKYSLIHLIRWMLRWDPNERPTIQQVLEHPFFNDPPRDTKGIQTDADDWKDVIDAFVNGQVSEQDFIAWWKKVGK